MAFLFDRSHVRSQASAYVSKRFKRRAIVVLASLILAAVLVIAVGLEMINGVLQ
jgi:hypothetical protein